MRKHWIMPMGMILHNRYCHKCGARLHSKAYTRTVSPNDRDYGKYARMGKGAYIVGDIDVTEYDYECRDCERVIRYDEQLAISRIQKKLKSHILSEEEYEENIDEAKKTVTWKKDIRGFVSTLIWLIGLGIAVYFAFSDGDFNRVFSFFF